MKYTQFLLDADETIFDFIQASKSSLQFSLEHYSIPYSPEIYVLFKKFNDGVWREYERGEIDKAQLRVRRFERFFSALGVCADAKAVDGLYFKTLCNAGVLLEGAEEFLNALSVRGKIHLLTNGTTAAQKGRIAASGINSYLSNVFISDELGIAKPRKEFFDIVLQTIACDKSKCIMIGDSLSSDILGANNAGIDCIWFNPSHSSQGHGDACPDYVAYSYAEVLNIIDRS